MLWFPYLSHMLRWLDSRLVNFSGGMWRSSAAKCDLAGEAKAPAKKK